MSARVDLVAPVLGLLLSATASFSGCRFFVDEDIPCENASHCPPEHACMDGRCALAIDPDAGTLKDGGVGDAGTDDAGTDDAGDAGTGDAGTGDAGTGDAGRGDAGIDDAGVDMDAGSDDAGVDMDAGQICTLDPWPRGPGGDAGLIEVDGGALCAPLPEEPPFDFTGDGRGDLLVGAPAQILLPAQWSSAGAGQPPGAVVFWETTSDGALLDSAIFEQSDGMVERRAGFGAAISLHPTAGFVAVEPGRTATDAPGLLHWYTSDPGAAAGFALAASFANGMFSPGGVAFSRSDDAGPSFVAGYLGGSLLGIAPSLCEADSYVLAADGLVLTDRFATQGEGLGRYVRRLHDLDGDGVEEVGVSAAGYAGLDGDTESYGALAISSGALFTQSRIDVVGTWPAPVAGESFGAAFEAVGDPSCDGRYDVALGAPRADAGRGRVYVERSAATPLPTASRYASLTSPAALSSEAAFGNTLERLPDLDGDGLPELLVGAPYHSAGSALSACAEVDGAPAGYSGDCAGAVVLVLGRELRGALLGAPGAGSTCLQLGATGERFGTAIRRLDRASPTSVRVAVGAPGHYGRAGEVRIYELSVDGGSCSFALRQTLRRDGVSGLQGDQFGAAIGH